MCVCVCLVCMCVHASAYASAKPFFFLRERYFCIHLFWAFYFLDLQSDWGVTFFSVWRRLRESDAGRAWLAGSPSLPASGPGLLCGCCLYLLKCFLCLSWRCQLTCRAPGCSWCVSQDFETYELAAGARECLSQFLGELHVFSKRLDHCPQSRLARQNVTVTVGDILNF